MSRFASSGSAGNGGPCQRCQIPRRGPLIPKCPVRAAIRLPSQSSASRLTCKLRSSRLPKDPTKVPIPLRLASASHDDWRSTRAKTCHTRALGVSLSSPMARKIDAEAKLRMTAPPTTGPRTARDLPASFCFDRSNRQSAACCRIGDEPTSNLAACRLSPQSRVHRGVPRGSFPALVPVALERWTANLASSSQTESCSDPHRAPSGSRWRHPRREP